MQSYNKKGRAEREVKQLLEYLKLIKESDNMKKLLRKVTAGVIAVAVMLSITVIAFARSETENNMILQRQTQSLWVNL